MSRARILVVLALVGLWTLLAPSGAVAQGCAMCGTAVQDPNDPLARSLATSILFMLSMPFLMFFTVGGWLFYRFRRAGSRRAQTKENPK